MAGIQKERQETAFIKAIKDAVRKNSNQPVNIRAGEIVITGVIDAMKYTGRQESGSEPYTDVMLRCKGKSRQINIAFLSLKGELAPSLAGGGMRGLEIIAPGIAGRFMKKALERLLEMGLHEGAKVPNVYGKIDRILKERVVIGTTAIGGPIDYMYMGPMDIVASYDDEKNLLVFNGSLIPAKEYAKSRELYFRLRARRDDQRFDPKAQQGGIPKIYGKSPSRGDSSGRIVVTDSVPKDAIIVEI